MTLLRFFKVRTLIIMVMVFPLPMMAQVTLPSLFTNNMVLQQQSNVAIWGWAKPGKTIHVVPSWNHKISFAKTGADGRWQVKLPTPSAGGPFEISISDGKPIILKNVLLGEVWLCSGQSNMEMPMKGFKGQPVTGSNEAILRSANLQVRLYTVPRSAQTLPQQNSIPSAWKMANPESVSEFSATAYYFGRLLFEQLKVPIGLINVSYGGTDVESWMSEGTLKNFEGVAIPAATDSIKSPNHTPTVLYNGMIHPIVGYGIRGEIWYQGESNYDRPFQYAARFAAKVASWRQLWGMGNFPVYFAQITPFNYASFTPGNSSPWLNAAYLRDAQRQSATLIPNSAMAVLLDVGDNYHIHPANKQTVGERLAYLALANTYGIKGFGAESPAYDSFSVKDSEATLHFKKADNWLTSFGRELKQFEIAGSDRVFHPAKAAIYRSTVKLTSPLVKQPVAARYAFRDTAVAELFGTDGLPVSSFRTDSW